MLVIPAKAGIHLDLAVASVWLRHSGRTHSPSAVLSPVSSPSAGADPPFLTPGMLPSALRAAFGVRAAPAAQCLSRRKVGQRKDIPVPRPPHIPVLRVRASAPGFLDGTSMYRRETRAHPAIAPAWLYLGHPCPRLRATLRAFLRRRAAAQGPQERALPARRSKSQEPRAKSQEPRAKSQEPRARSRWIPAFAGMTMRKDRRLGSKRSEARFCAQGCAPLSMGPLGRGEAGSDQPVGARAGEGMDARGRAMQEQLPEARAFSPVHGRTVENPGPASRTRSAGCAEGASAGCPFFGPPCFGQAKKGGSAPAEGDETGESLAGTRVCPPAVAEERKLQSKIKLDSSFRWNDEHERSRWFPASAGMTSWSHGWIRRAPG
jgi:hypothetical protein